MGDVSPATKGVVTVRRATPDDCDALVDLVRELNIYQNDPIEFFTEESVARDVFGPDAAVVALIGELDDRPAGYAFYHGAYESGWAVQGLYVSDLYVTENARRQGLAKALMAAIAREAKALGKNYLWWTSSAWNETAHEFYAAIGASSEPVIAHALTFEAFEALADEGESSTEP